MSEITINIDDYLSEEDKRQIAYNTFHAACVKRSHEDFERILSNAAYALVQKAVDDAFDGKMAETVKENAIKIINNLSSYSVFKAPDVWDKGSSKGFQYLEQAIEDARPAINERVLAIIDGMTATDLRESIEDLISDAIIKKLTTPSKDE